MNLHVHTTNNWTTVETDSLLLFYTQTESRPAEWAELDEQLGGELTALFTDKEAKGDANSVVHVRSRGRVPAKHIYLVGLGKADKLDGEAVRLAAGSVSRTLQGKRVAAVLVHSDQYAGETVEGLLLGRYVFKGYKSETPEEKALDELLILANGDIGSVVEGARINALAVNQARDLINSRANLLTPLTFAEKAAEVAQASGLDVEVLDEVRIEELGLNLLHAVGKGSDIPPRLVVLRYNGAPASQEVLGLVGKGVTYDSGGYIIKPETGMGDMHTDMAGAACVLSAMEAIAAKKLAVNVIGILVLAENMISGRAFKPGDVAIAFNGKSVELIDTDCEGRLVLADGVAYAKHLGATRIIDTATLTGAVTVALGTTAASLYGNNDVWVEVVKAAGAAVGEKLFPLPNYPEYEELIESKVADYINYSGRTGGAIAGGVFIAAFAEDVPFVHIDMANKSSAKASKGYQVEGGTAFSTRTLIKVAEQLVK